MEIRPIKTKKDYEKALERLEDVFEAKAGSKEGDELEVLSIDTNLLKTVLPKPFESPTVVIGESIGCHCKEQESKMK